MKKVPGLSAIIIARDEEKDIEDCLRSVSELADEIVLVDSGSTDKTLIIARRYAAQIHSKEFTGYADQKQFALDTATGPWVINIDADERVSPALADEIRALLTQSPSASGYDIPFHHYFLGTRLRFGGSAGETHVRLFRKEKARYGGEKVHEGINVDGTIGRLKNQIDHYSYRTVSDYLQKCDRYTSMIAEKKVAAGERFSFWHHLRLPYEFVVRYFLKLGFLDGEKGLVYALLSSYYVWLKFIKMRDYE